MAKKTISQIPQGPTDAWEAANLMHDLKPGDEGYNVSSLAGQAATEMKEAGWIFYTYSDWGDEVHIPPDWTPPNPDYPYT